MAKQTRQTQTKRANAPSILFHITYSSFVCCHALPSKSKRRRIAPSPPAMRFAHSIFIAYLSATEGLNAARGMVALPIFCV